MSTEFQAALELTAMLVGDPRTGLLIGLLIAAAWCDFGSGRIPNALVFGGSLAAVAYNTLVPAFHVGTGDAFLLALGGMACGLALTLPFYLLGAMAAGDVKLMAMCGAFLSFPEALWAVLASFVAGGLLSLGYLAARGEMRRAFQNITMMGRTASAGCVPVIDARTSAGTLPYGIAIAAGTIGYLVLRQLGVLHP